MQDSVRIVRDLSAQALEGSLRPVLGRNEELEALERRLRIEAPTAVLLRGVPGTGRLALAAGLAVHWSGDDAASRQLLALDAERLSASTIRVHEEVSEALSKCDARQRGVLVISNLEPLLRPDVDLNDEERRVIDAILGRRITAVCGMTAQIPKESAFNAFRWDSEIELHPLTADATRTILIDNKFLFEHEYTVRIDPASLLTTTQMCTRFFPDRALPGAAVSLLDAACARYQEKLAAKDSPTPWTNERTFRKLGDMVSPYDILKAVETLVDAPFEAIDEAAWSIRLAEKMRGVLPGRERPMTRLAHFMGEIRSRTRAQELPRFHILVAGPNGAGKNKAARELVRFMLGSKYEPILVDAADPRFDSDPDAIVRFIADACASRAAKARDMGQEKAPQLEFAVLRVTEKVGESARTAMLDGLRELAKQPYDLSATNCQIVVSLDATGPRETMNDNIERAYPAALTSRLFKHIWVEHA